MKLLDIIEEALRSDASDIHITVGAPPAIRAGGEITRLASPDLTPKDTADIADEIFEYNDVKAMLEEKGEVDFSFAIPNKGRFRANIYKQRGSIAIAIRLIGMEIPDVKELCLPEVVVDLWQKQRGMILVTGPTGSGKSTTLAALVNLINENRSSHIITLEDPIEYMHQHKNSLVNQREIGIDSKSFANALRSALREDPDVILIGELRDNETISTALTAAETGHLVFGTLHTMGAAKTIDRIIDSFPGEQQQQVRVQLASVLQAVITQQLIPNRDRRVPAFEVMICTHAVANLIREGKTHQIDNMIQTGTRFGMQTMDGDLMTLYKKGLISREDVLTYSFDTEIMEKMV